MGGVGGVGGCRGGLKKGGFLSKKKKSRPLRKPLVVGQMVQSSRPEAVARGAPCTIPAQAATLEG